jgi:hypothetical protein
MVFPQVVASSKVLAGAGNPQLFPACTQDRRHFAQVTHRLVHRKDVSVPCAGRWQWRGAPVLATRSAHQTRASNLTVWTREHAAWCS